MSNSTPIEIYINLINDYQNASTDDDDEQFQIEYEILRFLAFNQKESILRQSKKKDNILKNIQRRRRQSCVRTFS